MESDDRLDASMLEVMGEESVASLTPVGEAVLLKEDGEPWETPVTILHTPIWPGEAHKPDEAVQLEVVVAVPLGMQQSTSSPPPGFG